uniref:ABC transporter permease n=1 Tax=Candidatus Methanomethylicus mesodigestus TaxID=1867258 RepID=A0A7C3IXR0_9CREN
MTDFSNAMLVFWKDWREMRRNYQVIAPILFVPLIFAVILPSIIFFVPTMFGIPESSFQIIGPIFQSLPPEIREMVATMGGQQQMLYIFGLYFFAPFFLIIPLMASSVLASDSFAGEKDRKTLEALLATPLSDGELLLGKILVSFIPAMAVTVLSFAMYCVVIDLAAMPLFNGAVLLPNLLWTELIFLVTPTVALAGIGVTVIVSFKVKGYREAQQLSAILLIPVLAVIFAEISGLIIFGPLMILILGVGFAALDVVVFKVGIALFNREELLMKGI